MRESDLEAYLVRRVTQAGGECRKVSWPGRRGAPDRAVFLPGSLLWIELKAPGEKAKPHQIREHQRLQALGQTVHIVDSTDQIDELIPLPLKTSPILAGIL